MNAVLNREQSLNAGIFNEALKHVAVVPAVTEKDTEARELLLAAIGARRAYIACLQDEDSKKMFQFRLDKSIVRGSSIDGVNSSEDLEKFISESLPICRYEIGNGCEVYEMTVPKGYKAQTAYATIGQLARIGLLPHVRVGHNPQSGDTFMFSKTIRPIPTDRVSFVVHDERGLERWFPGFNIADDRRKPKDLVGQWVHCSSAQAERTDELLPQGGQS